MKADVVISWEQHLRDGNVWRVNVELPMQDVPDGEITFYSVDIHVVAPNQALAQYIVSTMYPDYLSLCIDDEPIGTSS